MAGSRWSREATIGVILIGAGIVIGIVLLALAVPSGGPLHPGATVSPSTPPTLGTASGEPTPVELGQHIYTTGTDENGRVIPRSRYMMFGRATCADCHGNDARGRTVTNMMGSFETPDIRWSTLSQPMKEDDGTIEPAYDPTTFGRAVTQGIDSAGGTLNPPMPRWQLTTAQIEALIAFLETR